MKRPAFQFYPADWRNNAKLRRCSWAARGVWIEIMGLLHDSDSYGILRWNLKEIALAIGCPISLVKELVSKDVLKGCDKGLCEPLIYTPRSGRKDGKPVTLIGEEQGPIWFSSRMVRDEYVRNVRGQATRYTSEDAASKPAPIPPFGEASDAASKPAPNESPTRCQSDGSSSSSSSSYIPTNRSLSQDLEVGGPVDKFERRHVAIAVFLRRMGIKTVTASHPQAVEWANDGRVTDEMLRAAVEKATLYKPLESITPAYLKPIVDDFLNPKKTNGDRNAARQRASDQLTGRARTAADEARTIDAEARVTG